ncbi:MAG: HAMP domain-containing sensor histidine kinase [Ilumatobacteraceae bacterium]|nr:HAMP domain-containing sensor histidine kinase [Ilumatobacteraceae bacterium]
MSLRWKFALALAAIVATTAVAFGTVSYRSTSDRLFAEIDRSLLSIDGRLLGQQGVPDRGPLVGFDAQIVLLDGTITGTTFPSPLPISEPDSRVLGRRGVSRFSTVETADGTYRVRTIGVSRGAVQVGRSLDETERILDSLRRRTLLIAGLVSAAAIALGLWISGRATASLRRLTAAAEHVESTGRLDVAVGEEGGDEVGRLGVAFDRMLAALARSKDEQRRLVQDAGHELRTPLTSLRTNLDTLRRYPDLSDADRRAIVDDLHAETQELTSLVDEVVAVAVGGARDEPATSFDLVDVVTEQADRYARRTDRVIEVDGASDVVTAHRSAVQRAVSCLLENATKFDTTGGPIVVTVGDDTVTVLDRGTGIPEADLDRVFDRFHRSDAARAMSGSGLGLSIVREVAQHHGGDAFASNRPGGGAAVGFRLGRLPPPTAE